jgi:molybdate transport system regulatory protein
MAKSIKHILNSEKDYRATGTLWLECEKERFFGPGRVELLEKIDESGSIHQAAKLMGMSYKKAWTMIDALNKQVVTPMVLIQTGGKNGGGSKITEEAKELINYHRELKKRFMEFLQRETKNLK